MKKIVVAFTLMMFLSVPSVGMAHAAYDVANISNQTVKKAFMTALYDCYSIASNEDILTYDGAFKKVLFGGEASSLDSVKLTVLDSPELKLPTASTEENDNEASCRSLLFGETLGFGLTRGLYELLRSDDTNLESQIEGLGYSKEGNINDDSADDCVKARYNISITDQVWHTTSAIADSSLICATLNGDTIEGLSIEDEPVPTSEEFPITIDLKEHDGVMVIRFKKGVTSKYTVNGEGGSWSGLKREIIPILADNWLEFTKNFSGGGSATYTLDRESGDSGLISATPGHYELNNLTDARNTAIRYFSNGGFNNYQDLLVGNQELFVYYLLLLNEFYYDGKTADTYWKCDLTWDNFPEFKGDDAAEIHFSPGITRNNNCRINMKESVGKNKKVNDFKFLDYYNRYAFNTSSAGITLSQLIDELNRLAGELSDEELAEAAEEAGQQTILPDDGGSSGGKTECEQVDLNGQGWILCPTLENLKNTTSLLDKTVENWLTVETGLYDSGSSTHAVWELMRNFGNWVIIILLLLIIFSQLTGVGIDNYGIKKMLPKIIVMAILINLSFIICELAVDLSNILGSALRDLFGGIGETLMDEAGIGGAGEDFISRMVTGIFAVGGMAGLAAPTVAALAPTVIVGGPMAVIVIILALLVILVAVLLFFAALGARMVIIIACIAVAPVAFALYALPNTQKMFKKWADLFKAALIIFPICGALSGVSKMVRGIVMTTTGEVHIWMLIVAMIAPYLVFFLLPSLLKGAIAALGVAGGALSSLGTKLRAKTSGGLQAVQGTEAFKENAELGKAKMGVWRADRIKKRYDNKDLSEMSDRRRERIQNKLNNANKTKLAWENRKDRSAIGADNKLGYDQELANSKLALENELEKKYAEGLQGETSRKGLAESLEGIIEGADSTGEYDDGVGSAALASATLKSLLDKGGIDEAFSTLEGFDWGKMSGRMQRRLIDAMGSSNVEAFKGFAKYRRSGGTGNFGDWVKGDMSEAVREADAKNLAKIPSFGDYLAEGGIGALTNMSKEEIGKVSEHIDSIITPNGPIKQEDFGRMLVNQIINTKDSKAKVEGDKMLAELVGNEKLKAEDLGISANILGAMDKNTVAKLDEGMEELAKKNQEAAQKFKAALGEQAKAARSDSRVWNRMDQQTQNFVNKHWGADASRSDASQPDVGKITVQQREKQSQQQQVEVKLDTSQADGGGELIIARDGSPNPPKYKKTFNINLKEGGE